jgi:hypothetical protein
MWVPCHLGMKSPQVTNGGNILQLVANKLNKQLRPVDKVWSTSFGGGGGGGGLTTPRH